MTRSERMEESGVPHAVGSSVTVAQEPLKLSVQVRALAPQLFRSHKGSKSGES